MFLRQGQSGCHLQRKGNGCCYEGGALHNKSHPCDSECLLSWIRLPQNRCVSMLKVLSCYDNKDILPVSLHVPLSDL